MGQFDFSVLAAIEQPQLVHVLRDGLARLEAVHAGVLAAVLIDGAVGVEDVDHRQLVAQTASVVVGVVGGRHLHAAGAQLRVHQ